MDTPDEHEDALLEAERHLFLERYRPIPLSDVTSGRLQPPPWLFGPTEGTDGLIRSRTITMISAEPFTGKTMLMLSMALSLATVTPLLDYKPSASHRVLFLGQDAPTWDYYGSIRKLWLGLGSPAIPMDRVLFFLNRGLRLDGPDISQLLETANKVFGVTVVMVDTLLAFHGKDENSNRDMAEVMDLLKAWRDRLGLTVIFSHHTAKPGAGQISGNYRARGASVIPGSVDFHLQLSAARGAVSMGIPKRRGASKRKGSDSFTISDLPTGGIQLRGLSPEQSAVSVTLGFISEPRTKEQLGDFLATQFSITDPVAKEGRLNGVLGYLRRKELATFLPDGRVVAARPS
jgi:AAA domain-containing protein